jgi:ATP-binding cassette, subfamily B, bacterial PglK
MSPWAGIRMVREILTPRERWQGMLVLGMNLMRALVDLMGVASVMPFLAVMGNPAMVDTNPVLRRLYEAGGFESVDTFLFALGVGATLLVLASALVRVGSTYVTARWIANRNYTLSTRLLQGYLRQPYEFFLNQNSATLSKSVLSEVKEVVTRVLKPGMEMLASLMVAVLLTGLLIAVDPVLALLITLLVGGGYGALYLGIRRPLRRIGEESVKANRERFTMASEAFGGIKDLKVLGREAAYLDRFRAPARRYARYDYIKGTLARVPRYVVEAIAFGGILAMALVLMATRGNLGEVLPILGVYAFGGLKLLPAVQAIYAGVTSLRFGWPALESVHQDLANETARDGALTSEMPDRFQPREGIRFREVRFRYPKADDFALEELDLTIPMGTSVGFVGQTGAGKTTAIDLLLGLLRPTEGTILLDGVPMEAVGVRSWQRSVGYVPQTIFLADASVSANIAFGVPPDEIDHEAVERAARTAAIHDFVMRELPRGYETEVGERGVRLSGGQRQRIGIARALYHDPAILVLDEATSALDTGTEQSIMEAVARFAGTKTLIIIAHRLSTVERCDQIVVLEGGSVAGIGSMQDLTRWNGTLRRLAAV